MKKAALFLLVPLLSLVLLAGCKGTDYTKHLSDVRSDLFAAETEDFSLTILCITRETPYAADGVACNTLKLIEIAVKPSEGMDGSKSYRIALSGEPAISGELSYRTVKGDYFLSQGVSAFPEGSVTVRLSEDGKTTELTATSIRTEKTLSPEEALNFAVDAERELIGRMTAGSTFEGEFTVRLMRRSRNYYFVGITGKKENAALLIDAETGEVLARRVR